MALQMGVRVRHKSLGEGVIAHGPVWAVGSDLLPGVVWSGPEHDAGSWGAEEVLFVVELDAAPVPSETYEDDAQLGTSRAWLLSGDVLEEIA